MAIQNGTKIYTGSHEITAYDILEVGDSPDTTGVKLSHTPVGETDKEIGFVYTLNPDGTYGETFTQASTAGQSTFKCADGVLTFNAGALTKGDRIACAYTYATEDSAQKIEMSADAIPATVLVSAYGVAKDVCSGEVFPCVVEGQAQIDGDWNFDLSADGDPVTQSLNMEFVRSCTSNKMYDFIIYTNEDEGGD